MMKAARLFSVVLMVAACGGDDGSKSGVPSTTADGGTTNTGTKGGSGNSCQSTDDMLPAGCTEADFKPYATCVQDACADKYKSCYGSDYLSGKFSGACATYLTCTAACACGDTTCFTKCTPSAECTTCLTTNICDTSKCQEPSCILSAFQDAGFGTGTGTGSSAHTCTDLTACCNQISDATNKESCNNVVSSAAQAASASNGAYTADSFCSMAYQGFTLSGMCK